MRRILFWLVVTLLVVAGLSLTVARLAQPPGGIGVRLVAFTPLAVLPWALVVLLLLARVAWPGRVGEERRRRLPWVAATVLALAPLGLHGWWLAPMYAGSAPAAGGATVTVVNVNGLLGRVDGVGVVRLATERDADLLVLEEVTESQLAEMRAAGLDEGWPHTAGTAGTGTDGTMVFSRFPLGDPQRVDTEFDSWRVPVQTPDGEVELLAVHTFPPTDAGAWRADLDAVVAAAPGADLVVGDVNATLDHAPLRRLQDAGFRDAAELTNAGWQPTWPVNGSYHPFGVPVPPLVAIDHVWVGPDWTALDTATAILDGTDHAALVARVAPR